jgi:hypothetical protein
MLKPNKKLVEYVVQQFCESIDACGKKSHYWIDISCKTNKILGQKRLKQVKKELPKTKYCLIRRTVTDETVEE